MPFDFPFNVLVTGASRGLGLGFVRALLAVPNANLVYAGCRRPDGAAELQALAAQHPQRLRVLALDVTREGDLTIAADTVRREHAYATEGRSDAGVPQLHLVLNVAGVLQDQALGLKPERRVEDLDPAALAASYAVNAIGPALAAKHFLPLLTVATPRAVFASLSARVGSIGDNRLGGWYAYRAAKAAQNQLLRTFAVEAARRAPKLIVAALHPGTVATDLSQPFRGGVAAEKLFTVEQSVAHLLTVIAGLQPADSGSFRAWDGSTIPW